MPEFVQIVTTTESREQAEQIASGLIERQLAACVQVSGPITSRYRWKGAVEQSQEWRCDAKTRADLFDRVAETIAQLHSYDVPEIIATPIVAIAESYQHWLEEQLTGEAPG